MKSMVQDHQIEILPHYNPDGTAAGIRVFKMPDGYRKTIEPAGTAFHTFDSTTGQYVEHKSSEPLTAGEVDDYETAAGNAAQKFKLDQASIAQKAVATEKAKADAGKATADAKKVPSEIRANNARADASEATAAKDRAISGTGPGGSTLVDSIGTGKLAPERISYLVTRNPELLAAVVQKYPDFSSAKAAAYPAVYHDFTSTKKGSTGAALNSGGTALKHMQELKALNTVKSHIPGTADYNAYMNKADTLSTELAGFYGDTTIPAISSIKSTLTATLPGQRESGIQTQAKSMGDKFDSYEQSWKNAAPSKSFEDPMPNVDAKAMEARAALDPRYRARAVEQQGGASQAAQPPALPTNAPPPAAGMSRIWAPGSPTWKDVPTNQIPKNVPGLVVK
jgi:hypothetical protein